MWLTVEHFARHHGGYEGLVAFMDACTRGLPLLQIGQMFDLSASQACRLRSIMMSHQWVPSKATLDYIEFLGNVQQRQADEKHQIVQSHLKLIQGRK